MLGNVNSLAGPRTPEVDPVLAFCPSVGVGVGLVAGRIKRSTQGKPPALPGAEDEPSAAALQQKARAPVKRKPSTVESIVDKSTANKSIVGKVPKLTSGAAAAEAAHAYGALAADVQAKEIADLRRQLEAKTDAHTALNEEVHRLRVQGAQAEGLATANERHIKMLTEELAAAKQRSQREADAFNERLSEVRSTSKMLACQEMQQKMKEVQADHDKTIAAMEEAAAAEKRANKAELDAEKADKARLAERLARAEASAAFQNPSPAPAPTAAPAKAPAKRQKKSAASSRTKEGPGRGPALADVPFQVAPDKFAEIKYEGEKFFEKINAVDERSFFTAYHTFVVNQAKMYYQDEIAQVGQQCRWHVQYFLRLLSLDTGKYVVNDVESMCKYLVSDKDISGKKDPGHLFNRNQQIGQFLWPKMVTDWASFKSPGAQKVHTKAFKHMTAVRALWEMYDWFMVKGKPMPEPWTEGVDEVPARKVKGERQVRKRSAQVSEVSGSGGEDEGEEGEEEEEAGAVGSRQEQQRPPPAFNDTAEIFRNAVLTVD